MTSTNPQQLSKQQHALKQQASFMSMHHPHSLPQPTLQSIPSDKFKMQKAQGDISYSNSGQTFFPVTRRESSDELFQLIQKATPKDYCTLLQHPFYYQNLLEMANEVTTVSSTHTSNHSSDGGGGGSLLRFELSEEVPSKLGKRKQREGDNGDVSSEEEELEEVYIEMFGNHKRKDTRIGTKFQAMANQIPLVTDIQYFEALQDLDRRNQKKCTIVWQPDKLPPKQVEYYLTNMELIWPYQHFHYQEEVALQYLHLKGYCIELALATVLFNADQLLSLLLIQRRKRRAQGLLTSLLMKQNQKNNNATIRILRDRKHTGCDIEELEMMVRHQQHKMEDFD